MNEEALEELKRAADLVPNDADIQFYLGRVYLELGNVREARLCFENALRLNPDDREAARLLGRMPDER